MTTTSDNHFQRLNDYRNSAEYAEYMGKLDAPDSLPRMLGIRWEINESIWDEFLNMLPPTRWTGNSFLMSEYCFGNITTKYTKEGNRYFCERVDVSRLP